MGQGAATTLPVEFYKALVDDLFDAVYTVDAGGLITYWNASAQRLTGYSPRQMVGQEYGRTAFFSGGGVGEPGNQHEGGVERVMETGMPGTWKGFVYRQNGQRVPVQSHIAPLRDKQGHVIGAVVVFRDVSALVALEEAHREAIEMSRRDQLTGLFNRAAITELLKAEIERGRRYGQALSVVMMDIDHFKRVNDNYGHEAGDLVLAEIGKMLGNNVRGPDVVGRWGGEEFLIVTPNVGSDAAVGLAERLRGYVRDMASEEMPTGVTASFGVSELAGAEQRLDDVVRAADTALYRAKESGRDRVVVANND